MCLFLLCCRFAAQLTSARSAERPNGSFSNSNSPSQNLQRSMTPGIASYYNQVPSQNGGGGPGGGGGAFSQSQVRGISCTIMTGMHTEKGLRKRTQNQARRIDCFDVAIPHKTFIVSE